MKKEGFYSVSQFMKLAHITKKTVRYYDEHDILKPAYVDPDNGSRFYSDSNLAQLQQILLLKTLGFSLSDIKAMTIQSADSHFMSESLKLQAKLVEDRIEQLKAVALTIKETSRMVDEKKQVDWSRMLDQIHNLGLESSMKNQYQNASNISSRISLHTLYSSNETGWFPWIYEQCGFRNSMHVLELGCGDGAFWKDNCSFYETHGMEKPADMEIILSDISEGMLQDTERSLGGQPGFNFRVFGCEAIPYPDDYFDIIIANHVLFYADDISRACLEIRRVLKPGGTFLCSTYGAEHMKEISQMVAAFDDRIILSAKKLYLKFGKENGRSLLCPYFSVVVWKQYEDHLLVSQPEPIISYVLSCHGNQNQYILNHYKEFKSFVSGRTKHGFYITKDAGLFICKKNN